MGLIVILVLLMLDNRKCKISLVVVVGEHSDFGQAIVPAPRYSSMGWVGYLVATRMMMPGHS